MELNDFVDIHTHGIGRYDTRTENSEHILKTAKLHAKSGTAAFLPTIYSGSIDEMRRNMEAVRKAMVIQGSGVRSKRLGVYSYRAKTRFEGQGSGTKKLTTDNWQLATILGVYLEGPFLNQVRCGAQDKSSFIKPAILSLKKLIDSYEDIIKIITIAPELAGALKVIEKCASLGIKVNMGHSDATYMQALEGKKAGATGISHIFNAMRPFHHREPSLIGFGLLDEDTYIEVIADNSHISHSALNIIFKTKRLDRIILVSDSVKSAKIRKGPIYPVRRKAPSELSNGVYSKPGVIAGSSITLSDAVKNIIKIGIPEPVAIEAAVDNPKRYLRS
jgi:N-acetylglucosamine-6-phosphate deacetylase